MDLLSVSALNNFVYCKRLFYYREVERVEGENYYLVDGQLKHEVVDGDGWGVRRDGEKVYGLALDSENLGITGRLDVLEVKSGRAVPVEYKRGEAGEWLNHRVQLCAQGLLLEEYCDELIDFGYIYYIGSRKRVKVAFDTDLREATMQAITEARHLVQEGKCPDVVKEQQCHGCSMLDHCLPQETGLLRERKPGKIARVLASIDEGEVLYITTNDVTVSKQSNRLLIKEDEKVVREVPILKIRKVVLFGRVNLSHPVISLLLQNNIEIVYANYYGKYEGSLIPPLNKNGLLRKRQVLSSVEEGKCLYLSRQFVRGKIHNMRMLLQRRNRSENDESVAKVIALLKERIKRLDQVDNLEALRGEEGFATRQYFQLLDGLLSRDVHFEKRNRRPPKDPVNALLSLGYSLLTKDVEGFCRVVGFDPYIGFFHRDRYGKPSLALDLMEEFRPLIVDQVVLYVFNSGILTEDDFEEEGQCRLKQTGLKKFLAQYEQRKKTEFTHPIFGYKIDYQRAFEIQARMLAKYLNGEIDEYIPLQLR